MVLHMNHAYDPFTDDLTGLPNLKALHRDLDQEDLSNHHFIYVDVDDYNKMNVVFGVDVVESMLVQLAKTLKNYSGKKHVYRVGNDQFLLVTKDIFICEPSKLHEILKTPYSYLGIQYAINVSICVIDYNEFLGLSIKDILKLAFITHDLERGKGNNRLIHASKKHKAHHDKINEIASNIHYALLNHEFYPKFRPFVDTFTYEVIGFESTTRWDLDGKTIYPKDFLEIAQWTGGIFDIEMDMLEQSLQFYIELKNDKSIKLSKRFKAGVKFSLYTLLRLEIKQLLEALKKYAISPKEVIIEIEETHATDYAVIERINTLRDLGFLIILDDYSNTSSSLSYLLETKANILKLSEQLLDEINASEQFSHPKAVYEFFVNISRTFDFTVVSSGVRTSRDLELIRDLEVNVATGDYFSKALRKEEFVQYLKVSSRRR